MMVFSIDAPERARRRALIDGLSGEAWTFAELCAQVESRRRVLRSDRKELLFSFCRNDLSGVAWYLAAVEAGHAVALASDSLSATLRAGLVASYRPEWVFSSGPFDEPGYRGAGVPGLWRRDSTGDASPHADLCLLLSTSGSTGSPKLVRLTRRNVEANADSIRVALGIESGHVPVAHLPLHYSYGLSVLNSHLLAGATTLLLNASLMTSGFWEAVRKHGANSFSGVPYTYQMLRRLDLEKLNAPAMVTMTQAGGKLDAASIAFFDEAMRRRDGWFWVMYGQTEATARIAILPAADLRDRPGCAGRAIPGGQLSVRLDSGELAAAGEGELVYRGPNVMMGYALERADLSLGDELGGTLFTGDRARLDETGYAYILGRVKRDAKVFGLRVNLDELEAFVKRRGPAAAIAGKNGIVVFCEFGDEREHQAIIDDLNGVFQIHRSAFECRRIDRLPAKDTGKIDYASLAALL